MNNITRTITNELPSSASLLKATAVAVVTAGALLVTTVLPAEYGVDPTGIGAKLGLKALSSASTHRETPSLQTMKSPVWKQTTPFKTETLTLSLLPTEGAEIKAKMKAGEHFVFSWQTEGGVVNFDMHGEPLNAAADEFTSYWKGMGQASGHGAFEAPIDGTHGWFWRNRTEDVVTVKVTVSGYFEKLYQP